MVASLAADKGHAKITAWRTGGGKRSFVQQPGYVIEKHRSTVVMNAEIGGETYREISPNSASVDRLTLV